MKRILLIVAGFLCCSSYSYGAEISEERIFGESIGLTGIVTADAVNIRSYPSLSANIITQNKVLMDKLCYAAKIRYY